jgi:ParB family chromosome partitioning protein
MSQRKLGRGLGSLLQQTRGRSKTAGSEDTKKAARRANQKDDAKTAANTVEAPEPDGAGEAATTAAGEIEQELAARGSIHELELGRIEPNPFQPRRSFDPAELDALKTSIDREGVLQPVLVRPGPNDGFQLVAGERRFRASRELGRETIPAIVVEVEDDRLLELALIENLHREDLNPIDTARAFQGLIEARKWTQEKLAKHLGLGRPTVSNTLRLLDLPENIQRALERGQIQMGHAKVLLSVTDSVEQMQLFDRIAENRMSVRELEDAVDDLPEPAVGEDGASGAGRRKGRKKAGRKKSAGARAMEEELCEALGTKVTIEEKKGKGVVKIEFYSPDDFEHIRALLMAALDGAS